MVTPKQCRDCEPGSKRPAPKPGPRCSTHHRAVMKARREKAHATRVQQTYGLGPGEYEQLLAFQGGVCALCRKPFKTKRGAVDHNHADGRVRGIIHGHENSFLGRMRDSVEWFERAAEYLRNPPARQAGLDRRPTEGN